MAKSDTLSRVVSAAALGLLINLPGIANAKDFTRQADNCDGWVRIGVHAFTAQSHIGSHDPTGTAVCRSLQTLDDLVNEYGHEYQLACKYRPLGVPVTVMDIVLWDFIAHAGINGGYDDKNPPLLECKVHIRAGSWSGWAAASDIALEPPGHSGD